MLIQWEMTHWPVGLVGVSKPLSTVITAIVFTDNMVTCIKSWQGFWQFQGSPHSKNEVSTVPAKIADISVEKKRTLNGNIYTHSE